MDRVNFEIRPTPDAPWERHLPPMPPDTLTKWSTSPAYDALARNLERPLTPAESRGNAVAAGRGRASRLRGALSLSPSAASDRHLPDRLFDAPSAAARNACAVRTYNIESDRDQVRKLEIGYSDDVSIFLNGQILYGGRSALSFRDPGFLGIVNTENDAVYLPLKKGNNELLLAVSELSGGWGFICRLTNVAN